MPRVKAFVFAVIVAVTPVFAQYGIDFAIVEDTVQTGTSVITWHFVLTNTGSVPDTYALDLSVIQNPGWFIQHCAGSMCTEPGIILTVELNPADTDSSIDVQVFIDSGPDTAILNYLAYSLGDTAQRDSFNLYAISELSVEEQDNYEAERLTLNVFPNPFSNTADIRYEMIGARYKDIAIVIYDISGRLVKQWNHPTIQLSNHIVWDGTDMNGFVVPEGVYIVRVDGTPISEQVKIVKLQ